MTDRTKLTMAVNVEALQWVHVKHLTETPEGAKFTMAAATVHVLGSTAPIARS